MSKHNHRIVASLDVGNGYLKAQLQTRTAGSPLAGTSDLVDLPSSVAVLTRPNQLPLADDEALQVLSAEPTGTDGFYNQLDASFLTNLVPDHYRRLFGQRSLAADGALDSFDVVSHISKARQPLAKALVLGLLTAKALRDHVRVEDKLPANELLVSARLALALPINEFMHHREAFAAEFTGHDHLVVIENFSTKISVRIHIEDVQVLAEGASAQYAIIRLGEPRMEVLLAEVASNDPETAEQLEGVTGADILAATNTVGIDIGEGTTDFPVFTNGRFNPDASMTLVKGWDTVLESTLRSMADTRASRRVSRTGVNWPSSCTASPASSSAASTRGSSSWSTRRPGSSRRRWPRSSPWCCASSARPPRSATSTAAGRVRCVRCCDPSCWRSSHR